MAESVGQIGLDLVVNQKQYNKQMSGIAGMAKKAGAALAAAFAVKKVVDFGAECVKLGSDLAEVQNVVDVTFPMMKSKVNEFAKSAAASFGLSETMAKKYSGAFGAMAKSFGFSEKEAYNMSTTLTGLSGDVASFYNISQDEAYTKLKSVFTGETETLKDLGVVMTQNALDSYALANGYGKVTAKMSEQEKVALRYKFVQDQLSASAGDFLRTSDSWANQTRLLSLQFDSLKASIGQGLINALTPVIKVINIVLGKIADLASGFGKLTGDIFGNQDSGADEPIANIADTAEDASTKVSGIGDSAKKAAKKMERSLMSFDKINKLSDNKDSGSSGGSGKAAGAGTPKTAKAAGTDNQSKKTSGMLDVLKKKFIACRNLFAKGFKLGAGNIGAAIKRIKKHLISIGNNLKDIFTDEKVREAFNKMVALFILNAGKIVGAIASIGVTIAENLIGGFDLFLQEHKEDIKQWLITMFDIRGEISSIQANFLVALADIFSVYRSYPAKQITADIIGILWEAFAGCTELFGKIYKDILNLITKPVIDNAGKIKTAILGVLETIQKPIGAIKDTVGEFFRSVNEMYNKHLKPVFDKLTEIISYVVGVILDKWNKYIAPVLKEFGERIASVINDKIRPALNDIVSVVSNRIELIKEVLSKLWDFLKPIVAWLVDTIAKVLGPVIRNVSNMVTQALHSIMDVVGGIVKVTKGVLDTIIGVFTGNKERVKKGASDIATGIWNAIKAPFALVGRYFTSIGETVIGIIKNLFSNTAVGDFFVNIWNTIKGVFSVVGSWFKSIFGIAWSGIKIVWSGAGRFFTGIWSKIKGVFSAVGGWFKTIFTTAWKNIKSVFSLSNVKSFFRNVWGGIKGAFGSVTGWFKDKFSAAWQAVKNVFSTGGKVFSGIKDGIASVFKMVVNKLISGINTIIAIPFKKINDMLNTIKDVKIPVINKKPFSGLWERNPLPTPQIPKLAQGGYVRKNTPQLAMIGDNRHQGEVVSPEKKLVEMARQAADMSSDGGMTAKVIELLTQILHVLEKLDLNVYIDGKKVTKQIVGIINQNTENTGKLAIEIR